MDYQMPKMDGIESTKNITQYLKEEKAVSIPIIACSAFNAKSDINSFIEAGAIAFLCKPIKLLDV